MCLTDLSTGIAILLLLFSSFARYNADRSGIPVQAFAGKPSSQSGTHLLSFGSDTSRVDTVLYKTGLLHLVHNKPSVKWPVKSGYPLAGAIFPFKRVVAYYGNYYSARMGILGELPASEMINKLEMETKKWELADSALPVQPALEYIVVTAQHEPGKDGKYRDRMPFGEIDKTLALAAGINAIVILDIQLGKSTLMEELPRLIPYLRLPNVHLAIDPEFSMKDGNVPGTAIGYFNEDDINYAGDFLATIVRQYTLPPKILVIHRFTKHMVTNYKEIRLRREVQLVMNMDGFGFPEKKINTYRTWITAEPVQFTGIKLFYKNDSLAAPDYRMMTAREIIKLYPSPIYIQYQ